MEWVYIKLDIVKNQKVGASGRWLPKQMDVVISERDWASSPSLQEEDGFSMKDTAGKREDSGFQLQTIWLGGETE